MPEKPITAIVVTYQSERTLANALAAARRCYDEDLLDLIIVDNGSTDGTRQIVEDAATWARCEFTGKNNGFGRGCNHGFQFVVSPYTILVNPDAVVEPDAIRIMLDFLERNLEVGIVGPAILEGEGDSTTLQHTGPRPTPWAIVRKEMPYLDRQPATWPIIPGSAPVRTGWVCGAVLMIRTGLMTKLNGFDPRFFLYWEEVDLCKRADDAGFQTWALGEASARHVQGASSSADDRKISGCIARHFYQSRYYYMTKHHSALAAMISELGEFVLLALRTVVDSLRGKGMQRVRPRLQAPLCSKPDQSGDDLPVALQGDTRNDGST